MARCHVRLVRAAAVLAALVGGCEGSRRVGRSSEVVAAAPVASAAVSAAKPVPEPAPAVLAPVAGSEAEPEPAAAAAPAPAPEVSLDSTLRPTLVDSTRAGERRQQFARAVAKISAELGVPITAEQALRDMPCGGWSGPDCSNFSLGLEIAKASAPVIASFHRRRTAEIATVLVQAVSIHAVWHDAYGYVRRVKKKGPGYTYAGCLFSRCDPDSLENGQVDGLLYQVGRLLGVQSGPACGPGCALADP